MRSRLIGASLGQLDRFLPFACFRRTIPEINIRALAGCRYLLAGARVSRRLGRAFLELDIRLPVAGRLRLSGP